MKHLLVLLAALVLLPAARAQAPRDVLLDVCNDTGFAVATAAAYRTSPTPDQTLRSWFLVEPGECLQGALNSVVGETLDLHVMSGSFHWPAGEGDKQICVPAGSGMQFASAPPCSLSQETRSFRTHPITSSGRRGAGNRMMGQISARISCHDLESQDARLCLQAPRDERGLAQLTRTLEVCNSYSSDLRVAAFEPQPDGSLHTGENAFLAQTNCLDLYRGFPSQQRVLVGFEVSRLPRNGGICWFEDSTSATLTTERRCPDGATPMETREAVFGSFTDRYTVYIARN
ncbi:DUF1036 domain-containing protein [Maricaulis sp.]|uniref:DUF1036 domain-containing protein n=1 Tax=unclassified Maricaulis TaxID=2632371 RepID=UPI001B18E186|nr:DUF1036 domain-containing protein [Maricaulis sp.]MBO6795608.1 DUF1036 domain-containing protein [Maricaulis sp.]